MEDFLCDEAARTLRLEYSVQPLHLSCAEPANIETTYYYLRHVMYGWGSMLCSLCSGLWRILVWLLGRTEQATSK